MITRVEGTYLGAVRAFQNPMLDLLHKRHAPLVVSVLSLLFTPDRPTVPVAQAHTEVGEVLEQLRAAGYGDDLPAGTARELCRSWADKGWLVRQVSDDVEVYRLSAHAVGALEVAGRAGGGRARVSQSRVRTLLDAVEHLAQDADPDVMVRIARLDAQIARLQAELDEVQRTGTVEEVDDDELLEEAENVVHLVRELPADFARVAESIKSMQHDVVTALRQDERPTGEVLREYLHRGEQVMDATAEGRAFVGALRLLGDPQRRDDLAARLDAVLRHRFTQRMDPRQRQALTEVVVAIERGIGQVLAAQREASSVITAQVRHHDPLRDREVDDLLRDVMAGLQRWVPGTRRARSVDPVRRLPVADVDPLRLTPCDLAPPQPPEPLTDRPDDTDPDAARDAARAWGGPHYDQIAQHLAAFTDSVGFVDSAGETDVAQVFAAAPPQIRRPVDLLGLLEVAHQHRTVTEIDAVAFADTVRPDGTRRRFAFAAVTASAAGTPVDDAPVEPVR